MTPTFHVDPSAVDPFLRQILRAAFPDYTGRTVQIRTAPERMHLRSFWDGGSRSTFVLLRLDTMACVPVPDQSPFDRPIAGIDAVPIPDGVIVVEHALLCGKDLGIRIYVPAANRDGRFLPPAVDLTPDEHTVLDITGGIKSGYRDDERRRRGLSRATWDACKTTLQAKGFLAANGAITPAGRNAREACHASA